MYKQKTEPFKHQQEALDKSWMKRNFAYFMEMGCFTGEVEILTNRGFIKFKDIDPEKLERPFLVAQAIPDPGIINKWAIQFAEPEAFIHKKEQVFPFALVSSTTYRKRYFGMTKDHRIPCFDDEEDLTARMIYKGRTVIPSGNTFSYAPGSVSLFSNAQAGLLPSDSKYFVNPDPELAALSIDEIRFMVAVIADGTYPNKNDNKVDFDFTKRRKFLRLQEIAARAGIPLAFEAKIKGADKKIHYIVHAIAPVRYKKYSYEWYYLNAEQVRAVALEAPHWDGTFAESQHVRFYSTIQESIDYIQYAFFCNGTASKSTADATTTNCLQVSATLRDLYEGNLDFKEMRNAVAKEGQKKPRYPSRVRVTAHMFDNENVPFDKDTEYDVYCVRVPSGYFVARFDGLMFITGNSGKTKVMIDNIGMLYDKGSITGALILAPKGVYQNWSEKEIPTHLSDDIERDVIVWDASATDGQKRRMKETIDKWNGKNLQFLVFNIESLISEKGKALVDFFIKKHNGKVLALVDESTCIKNHKAKRTKEAVKIGSKCLARRIATGSPVTNSPLDLYAQCSFLDKSLLGHGSYYSFRNTYANVERVMNRQGQSYDKILSYKNLDDLSDKLGKFSYRITKKECLDLPDKIYQTRYVTLTPEQIKVYHEMADSQFSMLIDKDGNFTEMSSRIILTKLLRLHQVLCGLFTSDDGVVHRLPNNRIEELKSVLDESSGKVIIWATYIPNIEDIATMLEKEYGADSFVTYYGDTTTDDRNKAILKFQDENSPVRFFLGNVQTAGRGITLTAADTVVYFSNNFSLELRQQSEDRAHRVGQKNNVTYVDLMVPRSMDEKVIRALLSKKDIAETVMKDSPSEWISL